MAGSMGNFPSQFFSFFSFFLCFRLLLVFFFVGADVFATAFYITAIVAVRYWKIILLHPMLPFVRKTMDD